VTKDTELLAEKHKLFRRHELRSRKLFQFRRCEERKSVEHSRETFFERRFGGI